jgi:hypothetical protein
MSNVRASGPAGTKTISTFNALPNINCAARARLARAKIRPKYIPFVHPGAMDQELLFLFNVFL